MVNLEIYVWMVEDELMEYSSEVCKIEKICCKMVLFFNYK